MNDPHAKLANTHLSIFRPYTGNPKHEDQLTRAALIVMKFVPRAHDALLAMIGCSPLSKLPASRFDLQTEKLVPPGDGDGNVDKLVSVFLTPDEHVAGFDQVEASERRARYDGVIQYGSKLLVVVESKLFTGVSFGQAKNINPKGSVVWKKSVPKPIQWHELLNRWWDLLESGSLDPAESEILSDFFDFSETNFGDLLPFTDLGRCKKNQTRLLRRLRSIMQEATGLPAEITSGAKNPDTGRIYPPGVNVKFPVAKSSSMVGVHAVDRVGIWIESGVVHLAMWSGELQGQYRYLYGAPQRVEALIALTHSPGWKLKANFHLGFRYSRSSQRWYPDGKLSGDKYVRQWVEDVGKHAGGRTPAEIADKGFRKWLLNRHYATNEDLIGLNKWISARSAGLQIHVRPSVQIQRTWKLATAVALDRESHFADDVKHAIDSMLAALDEPPLGALAQLIPNPDSSTVVDS